VTYMSFRDRFRAEIELATPRTELARLKGQKVN
jgi:hypothetical protein